jgi:hypothetical protein
VSASLRVSNGSSTLATVTFSASNAASLLANQYAAYDTPGLPMSRGFLGGLPFFCGRNVYTVLDGAKTGPFVAF